MSRNEHLQNYLYETKFKVCYGILSPNQFQAPINSALVLWFSKKKSCEKAWGVGEREGGGFFFPPPLSSPDRARLFSFCLPCSVFATSLLFERLAKASSRQDMNALNLMCRRKDYWTEELFMWDILFGLSLKRILQKVINGKLIKQAQKRMRCYLEERRV